MMTCEEKILALEKELALYKRNGAIGMYYELNRLVNETVDQVRNMKINDNPVDTATEKKNDRISALVKTAKEHIKWMNEIKTELKLTGDEKTDKEEVPFAESFATSRK
jgi:hypothetical protein